MHGMGNPNYAVHLGPLRLQAPIYSSSLRTTLVWAMSEACRRSPSSQHVVSTSRTHTRNLCAVPRVTPSSAAGIRTKAGQGGVVGAQAQNQLSGTTNGHLQLRCQPQAIGLDFSANGVSEDSQKAWDPGRI